MIGDWHSPELDLLNGRSDGFKVYFLLVKSLKTDEFLLLILVDVHFHVFFCHLRELSL